MSAMKTNLIAMICLLKQIEADQHKNKNGEKEADGIPSRWEKIQVAKIRNTENGTKVTKKLQTGRRVNVIMNRVNRLKQLIAKTLGLTVDPIIVYPHSSGDGTYVLAVGTHRVWCHIDLGYKEIWAVVLQPHEIDVKAISLYARAENVETENSFKTAPPSLEDWKPCAVQVYTEALALLQQSLPPNASDQDHKDAIEAALAETKEVLDEAKFSEWDYNGKQWNKLRPIISYADIRKLMKFSNLGGTLPKSTANEIANGQNCSIMNKLVACGAWPLNGKKVPKEPTHEGWLANVEGNGQLEKTLGRIITSNRERIEGNQEPLKHEILAHASSVDNKCPEDVDKSRREFEGTVDGINDYFKNMTLGTVEKFLEVYEGDVEALAEALKEFLKDEPDFIEGVNWICQHDSEVTIDDDGNEVKKLFSRGASAHDGVADSEETQSVDEVAEHEIIINGVQPQAQLSLVN